MHATPLRGKLAIMATNAVLPGPTSKRVSENIERLRKARGLSQAQLANKLTKVGRPMLDTAVSKMERGTRRVDVDDLVAIAIALNVTPIALLMPNQWDMEPVALTESFDLPAKTAWRWAEGVGPATDFLVGPEGAHSEEEIEANWKQHEEYMQLSHPAGRFSISGSVDRVMNGLRAAVDRLFAYADEETADVAAKRVPFDDQVATVNNWFSRAHADVDVVVAIIRKARINRTLGGGTRRFGNPFEEQILLDEYRNDTVEPDQRATELRDLGVEDPDRP